MQPKKLFLLLIAMVVIITVFSGCQYLRLTKSYPIMLPDAEMENVLWRTKITTEDNIFYVDYANGRSELRKVRFDGTEHIALYSTEMSIYTMAASTEWAFVSLDSGEIVRISLSSGESTVIYHFPDNEYDHYWGRVFVLGDMLIVGQEYDATVLSMTFDGGVISSKALPYSSSDIASYGTGNMVCDGSFLIYFYSESDRITYKLDVSLQETALWSFNAETVQDSDEDTAPALSISNCLFSYDRNSSSLCAASDGWLYYQVSEAGENFPDMKKFYVFRCNAESDEQQYLFETDKNEVRITLEINFVRDNKIYFTEIDYSTSTYGFYCYDIDASHRFLVNYPPVHWY